MTIDPKLLLEGGMLLGTVIAIYFRLHFHQKEIKKTTDEHTCEIRANAEHANRNDHAIAALKLEMERRFNDFEKRIEKKLSENNNKIDRRLLRIEKILIKIDERMQTEAAASLMEEEH